LTDCKPAKGKVDALSFRQTPTLKSCGMLCRPIVSASALPRRNWLKYELWRKLKYESLRPEDYADKDTLHLDVWQALSAVGKSLNIQFSAFKQNSLT